MIQAIPTDELQQAQDDLESRASCVFWLMVLCGLSGPEAAQYIDTGQLTKEAATKSKEYQKRLEKRRSNAPEAPSRSAR